jgi:ferritin-like metal-binding protein YciE
MTIHSLQDFYVDQLKDVYSAEKQLLEALPQMAKAATNADLKLAFQNHAHHTENHMTTVQGILKGLNENPGSKKCKAMEGLIAEATEVVELKGDPQAKDAALILAAQKVEHYEIATYGGLRTYATALGFSDVATQLQDILDEEYDSNDMLDDLAMGSLLTKGLNEKATA